MPYKKHSLKQLNTENQQAEQLLNKQYREKMRKFENKANLITTNNDTFFEIEVNNAGNIFFENPTKIDLKLETPMYDNNCSRILDEYLKQLKIINDENSKSGDQFKNEKRDMNETTISKNEKRDMNETTISLKYVAQKFPKAQDSLPLNREKLSKLSNIEDSLVLNKERLAKKLDQPGSGRD